MMPARGLERKAQPTVSKAVDRSPALIVAVLSISALAWLAMMRGWPGLHSPAASVTYSRVDLYLAQAANSICGRPPGAGAALAEQAQWLAGWAIMVAAMMLPPGIPFLRTVAQLSGTARARVVLLAASSFLAVWTATGVVLITLSALLGGVDLPAALDHPALLAGAAAIMAGAYQFTPLKKACLSACRSPRAVLLCHWNGMRPASSALATGLRYGAICVGCCWATMLLTLVVGAYGLPLMVAVSIVMLAERLLPWTRAIIPVQAGLSIGLGGLLILGWLPPAAWLAMP